MLHKNHRWKALLNVFAVVGRKYHTWTHVHPDSWVVLQAQLQCASSALVVYLGYGGYFSLTELRAFALFCTQQAAQRACSRAGTGLGGRVQTAAVGDGARDAC